MSGNSDSHTRAWYSDNIFLPIKIKIINDKIFIDKFNGETIKSQILSINGIDIEIIKKELEKSISYGTKSWLERNYEVLLPNLNVLKSPFHHLL